MLTVPSIKPRETLKQFMVFCGKHKLHFISDEIYAKSVFKNSAVQTSESFVSALSIETEGLIDPTKFHVLYGASKDFCVNGLRIGAVFTKNQGILGAMTSIRYYSCHSYLGDC